jgi:hypothetical protein
VIAERARSAFPTRLALASTSLAVLLAIAAQSAAPTESDLKSRAEAVDQSNLEKSAELVRWAFDHDLFREAAGLARAVLAQKPEHEVGRLLSRIESIPQAEFVAKYRDALRTSGSAFQAKRSALARSSADSLIAIARDAEKATFDALAESVYLDAARVDSANAAAVAALKKRDYDVIFNFGPVPKSEKEEARKTLQKLGGGFLVERDLKSELAFWSDAWGMSTAHYRLVTNVSPSKAFRFAQDCEDLYAGWGALMKELGLPIRDWKDRCSVYLFDSGLTYQVALRTAKVDPPKLAEAMGFYWGETKIGYFYDDPKAYEGDVGLLAETLYHEGGHQLFDLRFKIAARGQGGKVPCAWIDEGLAVYLESLSVDDKGKTRAVRFGSVLEDDVAEIVDEDARGELANLSTLLDADDEAFAALGADGQAHAAALVHFLLHGNGGAYRKTFAGVIDSVQKCGGLKAPLNELLGMKSASDLESKFRAYVHDSLAKLPRRKYHA